MAGRLPEERVDNPVTHQRWGSLTFLHVDRVDGPDVHRHLAEAAAEGELLVRRQLLVAEEDDQVLQQRRGGETGLAELEVQGPLDGQ